MQPKRRRRLIILGIVLTLFVSGGLLLKNYLTERARLYLETRLSREVDGTVSIDAINVSMLEPVVEISGISIQSPAHGVEQGRVGAIEITFQPFPIFLGKVVLSKVEARDTTVTYSLPLSQEGPAKEEALENLLPSSLDLIRVDIRQFDLRNTTLNIKSNNEWQVQLKLESFQATQKDDYAIAFDARGVGEGVVKAQLLDADEDWAFPIRTFEIRGDFDRSGLHASHVAIDTPALQLTSSGTLYPATNLDAVLQTNLVNLPFSDSFGGILTFDGNVRGRTYPIIDGKLTLNNARYGDAQIGSLSGKLEANPERVDVRDAQISFGGSRLDVSATWKRPSGQVTAQLRARQFELNGMKDLMLLVYPQLVEVGGSTNGNIDIQGTLRRTGEIGELSGSGTLSIANFLIRDRGGRLAIPELDIATRAHSSNGLDWFVPELILQSEKLQAKGEVTFENGMITSALRASLNNVWRDLHPALSEIAGSIQLDSTLQISPEKRTGKLTLNGEALTVGETKNWDLDATLSLNDYDIKVQDITLTSPKRRIHMSGGVDLLENSFLPSRLFLKRVPSEFAIALLPIPTTARRNLTETVTGEFSGRLTLAGNLNEPNGQTEITLFEPTLGGEPFVGATVNATFESGIYEVQRFTLRKPNGELKIHGKVDLPRSQLAIEFQTDTLNTREFVLLADYIPAALPFSFQGQIFGDVDKPNLEAAAELKDSNSENLITVNAVGQLMQPRLSFENPQRSVAGSVRLDDPTAFELKTTHFDFAQFARVLGHEVDKKLQTILDVEVHLADLHVKPRGEAAIRRFDLTYDSATLLQDASIIFDVDRGNLKLRECHIKGVQSNIRCSSAGKFEGDLNLQLLRILVPAMSRSEGILTLDAQLTGPLEAPRFSGSGAVRQAAISFHDFPTLLEEISAQLNFQGSTVVVNNLRTRSGDGTLKGSGEIQFPEFKNVIFDLNADVKNFGVRYPPTFPTVVDGSVRFYGPVNDATLEGELDIVEARYTERTDWRSRLLNLSSSIGNVDVRIVKEKRGGGRGVNFDLHAVARKPVIKISNNLAQAQLTGDFHVEGKIPEVWLRGIFEVAEGAVVFRDQEFEIDSGTIRFSPGTLRPFIDIYASATIRQYNVTINLHTVDGEIRADLNSTPPLNETDLVALVTVGVVPKGQGTNLIDSSEVTSGVAVGIMSGNIQDEVEKIGIIDTFQVVPAYSDATRTTELRLRVGKAITRDLLLSYSTDLYNIGINQEMRLEQNIRRNFSILGTISNRDVDQTFDLGVDLEFSFDF